MIPRLGRKTVLVSSEIHSTHVALSQRGYDIQIGRGLLDTLPSFLRGIGRSEHAVIITDATVDELYADAVGDRLVEQDWQVHVLVVEPGEQSKSIEVADDLWNTMLDEGADRQSLVVAIGGGVVGDLAGFVAATFARGLDFVQAP
ncbi:MAG: iron-containing alcohol dehydrogenase, partial [Planctomycetota bacterium]